MNLRIMTIFAFFLVIICSVSASPDRPRIGRSISTTPSPPNYSKNCIHDRDCDQDECCVTTPSRYSVPACMKFRQKNENCRPGATKVTDLLLHYPDGSKIHLEEAHYALCPCEQGLACNRKSQQCDIINEHKN